MGVSINLEISRSVTKQEWEKVYEESLKMVNKFPFAERDEVEYHGKTMRCMIPTKEREFTYDWGRKTRLGWCADGDYETLKGAEEYFLARDLVDEDEVLKDAGDAIMGVLPAYLDYDWDDERCKKTYSLWGDKTQGEPYHMFLLAVACMIEDRLKEKAFVYGDITRGQCRKAVEMANEILDEPIQIPARCDMERFKARVAELNLEEKEKLTIFFRLYLGTKNTEFGEYIAENFDKYMLNDWWKDEFGGFQIGTIGFSDIFKEYLSLGFDLGELCSWVDVRGKDGQSQYEQFIHLVMKANLHIKDKDCTDALSIDEEEEHPYGVERLFAQFLCIGAKNTKVNRYIPLEKLRSVLNIYFGQHCDVDSIIDSYIQKEEELKTVNLHSASEEQWSEMCDHDASSVLNQVMEKFDKEYNAEFQEYNISSYEDLIYYEKGDSVHPKLMESVGKSMQVYRSVLQEEKYKELMRESAVKRCHFLMEKNQYIWLRNRDWKSIFTRIEQNVDAYERYYPMVRVDVRSSSDLRDMVVAFVLNDELYEYSLELAEHDWDKEEVDQVIY